MRTFNKDDIYNFTIEFNRIESYNKYCKDWFSYFNINIDIINKTNWTNNDFVDMVNFNRVKRNINTIMNVLEESKLNISNQYNQIFDNTKAQEIESKLQTYLDYLGNWEWQFNVCGISICGNDLKLGGIN